MTLTRFATIRALHVLAAASPGPAILLGACLAATEGLRTGAFFALGVACGGFLWATAALLGLSVLFGLAPGLPWGVKIAGGLFIAWIGLQMWRHAAAPLRTPPAGIPARSDAGALRLGLVTQRANPKSAVFFGAVFATTMPHHATWPVFVLRVVMVFVNEALVLACVARLFSLDRPRLLYARVKSAIDRSFGVLLGLLGIKVALT
jgi:threonine/homoserine/homoserine lactone efflux protein